MGLASKIQASGRPALGANTQAVGGAPLQSTGQVPYGQQGNNAPYPTQQQGGQAQYGQAPPYGQYPGQQQPQMNSSTKPGAQGYSANQPPANPFAQGASQQPGIGQQGYGQQNPQMQQPMQATGQYGQTGGQAPYGQQPQYGQQQQNQQQYGQQQPPTRPPQQAGAGQSGSVIRDNLTRIVRENQLEPFYPPQKLQQVIAKVEAINFQALSSAWDIPMEIATDLAALALYDIVFYCDDSGSMRAEERGERIDDLKLILSRVSEVATMVCGTLLQANTH